jgi:hypothetical protein
MDQLEIKSAKHFLRFRRGFFVEAGGNDGV